jgi:hypothetical protein
MTQPGQTECISNDMYDQDYLGMTQPIPEIWTMTQPGQTMTKTVQYRK